MLRTGPADLAGGPAGFPEPAEREERPHQPKRERFDERRGAGPAPRERRQVGLAAVPDGKRRHHDRGHRENLERGERGGMPIDVVELEADDFATTQAQPGQ